MSTSALFLHTDEPSGRTDCKEVMSDPRTLEDLHSLGLDTEAAGVSLEPSGRTDCKEGMSDPRTPLFRTGCPVLSLGELETYISHLLDVEQGI